MKTVLKISFGLIITVFLFFSINGTDLPEEKPVKLSPENRFKQDMLESIMEFANDSLPVDSLYIPDWLQ